MRKRPRKHKSTHKDKQREHDRRTELFADNPELLGLENIVLAAREVNLFLPDMSGLIAKPDNMYIDQHGKLYIAEYKGSNQWREKAIRQLHTAADVIEELYGKEAELLYVHNKNQVEYIK